MNRRNLLALLCGAPVAAALPVAASSFTVSVPPVTEGTVIMGGGGGGGANITIYGSTFTRGQLRELVESINVMASEGIVVGRGGPR